MDVYVIIESFHGLGEYVFRLQLYLSETFCDYIYDHGQHLGKSCL